MTETSTQPAAAGAESSRQEQRGVTVIPAQVVAQIAAQAAYEHFTGLKVEKINIEISWLNPSSQARRALR